MNCTQRTNVSRVSLEKTTLIQRLYYSFSTYISIITNLKEFCSFKIAHSFLMYYNLIIIGQALDLLVSVS